MFIVFELKDPFWDNTDIHVEDQIGIVKDRLEEAFPDDKIRLISLDTNNPIIKLRRAKRQIEKLTHKEK